MRISRKFTSSVGAIAALLLCMVLAACGGQGSATSSDASSDAASSGAADIQPAAFTQKDVPVFREGPTDETFTLRFYDETPIIAYVSLKDFYHLMLPQGSMDVERRDDGTYLFTSHTGADPSTDTGRGLGGTAIADPVAGTLTSPDLPAFTNMMTLVQEGMDNGYLDGMPFVRVSHIEYDREPEPVTLDFARYGIALYADEEDVYFPFQTVSAIYSDFDSHYASYNGEKVYVNSDNDYARMEERDPEFSKPILASQTRPDDLAAFSYAHLRFCIDYFDAVPSRMEEKLGNHDVEGMLDGMGEAGELIKRGLTSTNLAEYCLASDSLGFTLDDGGHTALSYASNTSLLADEQDPLHQEFTGAVNDPDNVLGAYYVSVLQSILPRYQVAGERVAVRDEAYGKETYIKKGDTAVIVFDAFAADQKGWEDYFAGTGERPSATQEIPSGDLAGQVDSVAIASEGLARAQEDPEVKNVVLDISNNSGGSLDVLVYLASVVSGRDFEQCQNTLTKQLFREYFDVDRNLDGTFDEKDDLVDFSDLNIAVLTSRSSFSCGNILPSVLADEGIMVMGERSGGGSCAVQKCVTADGVGWQMSTWRGKLINDAGQDIDDGVPVDVDLLERTGSKKTESGNPDYSGFYDIDLLSEVMNEYFGERTLAEAA